MPRYEVYGLLLIAVLVNPEVLVGAGLASLNIVQHQKLESEKGVSRVLSRSQTRQNGVAPSGRSKGQNRTATAAPKNSSPAVPELAPSPPENDSPSTRPPRSKRLDIVLAHYHQHNTQQALDFWEDFLGSQKVQAFEPYVFLYCQNDDMRVALELVPLLKHGGEIVHLPNVGRESHAYLQHIVKHNGDLADHTLFSQAIPDPELRRRFEMMFDSNIGFLPLSFMGHVDCKTNGELFVPDDQILQMYAMLTRSMCPPEGYSAAFEGQFAVSRKRILANDWWVYRHLLDLVSAPLDHWVHAQHEGDGFKDVSNPVFGHTLERSWSLMFNCYESWRQGNCYWCEHDMHMVGCGKDACQCFDTLPEGVT